MKVKRIVIMMSIVITILLVALYFFYINRTDNINSINDNVSLENKKFNYDNPPVPQGFKKVETKQASWELENGVPKGWDKGLVIEDEIDNQFVWVPVDENKINYETDITSKIEGEKIEIYGRDGIPENVENEYSQVKKYGGFYVARYEAGVTKDMQEISKDIDSSKNNINGIPVSKKNVRPWNYISYNNARKNSESMIKSEEVQSGLITVNQWYYIVSWLEEAGFDTNNDSKEWGNYSNVNFNFTGLYSIDNGMNYEYTENKMKQTYNMILSTGASDRNCANNLYDIAGNLSEWISGYYKSSESNYLYSGGYYDNVSKYNMGYTLGYFTYSEKIGFRVVLYIK